MIRTFICSFMFAMFFSFVGDSVAQKTVAKSRKQSPLLENYFYKDGSNRLPYIVKTKDFTYYNMATQVGGNSIQNLVVNEKEDCTFVINDCIRRVCKRKKELEEYGSYVYCSSNSLNTVSSDIENCLIDKGVLDNRKYGNICRGYVMDNLYQYYDELRAMESEFAKVSALCVRAKDALYAAEQCYFHLMGYNGNFDESLKKTLRQFCGGVTRGGSEQMLEQFFAAGSYGMSDIYAGSMVPTLPFTNLDEKRENWKEVVGNIYDRFRKDMISNCSGNIE